jgi:hypothetical protein
VNDAEPSEDWLNPLAMAGKTFKGPPDSFYFAMLLHHATSPCYVTMLRHRALSLAL